MPDDATQPPVASDTLQMTPVAAAQFAYHVRMAATCAIAGKSVESASEAVLAWAMLSACSPDAAADAVGVGVELIDPDDLTTSDAQRRTARSRARDLALSLEAHFVSVGQHEHSHLYQAVADDLDDAVDALSWRS